MHDWIEQLETAEACRLEAERLLNVVADIKGQIEMAEAHGIASPDDRVWIASARTALRYRQRELQRVQARRGELRLAEKNDAHEKRQATHDRLLLRIIRDRFPEQFYAAVGVLEGQKELA